MKKMIPKFKCQSCGQCCSRIRGKIEGEEKEFLEEYAYGKLPLVQLFPIDRMTFPLFDFEAKRFKEWEKEAGINAKITPSRVIFDLNTNRSIIVTYYMDHSICPFLKDKKCLLYKKKRAFICRLFPFNKGPFLKTGEESKKIPNRSEEGSEKSGAFPEDMFGSCPAIEGIIPQLDGSDRKKMVNQLVDSFGDNFLNMLEYDHLTGWINKLVIELKKQKIIRPALNYPYRFLKKRVENSEKIDLMDFLVEQNVKTKQEAENLINRFDNNEDAKEKLKEFQG